MKAIHNIIVFGDCTKYSLFIRHKVSVLRGTSGTGKTYLCKLLTAVKSGVKTISCNLVDKIILLNYNTDWGNLIPSSQGKVFIADEGINYIYTSEFTKLAESSDNYFIFITRRNLLFESYALYALHRTETGTITNIALPVYEAEETESVMTSFEHTIYFGIDDNASIDPDANFFGGFLPEWLEDPLVKDMIQDVDQSEVKSPYCIQSPVLGQISPEHLSGGVKALILLLKLDDYYPDLTVCGENCAKWFKEIAKVKPLKLVLSSYDMPYIGVELRCLSDGSLITTSREWADKCTDFIG